jgi:N6-adenosine-specific RNA methylase IME4
MTILAGAVLADPPWHWKARSSKGDGRSACQHYSVMSLDDLKAYPVAEMAAADSWLFLWIVSSMLPAGLEVMAAGASNIPAPPSSGSNRTRLATDSSPAWA